MSRTLLWKRLLIWGVCLWGILFALPNAFYPTVERHNDAAAILAETGTLPQTATADLEGWPSWLPSSLVALGLDLRGGASSGRGACRGCSCRKDGSALAAGPRCASRAA